MTLDVHQLVLFGIFTSALHWLVARSEIARPLWSRARGWLAALLSCPACSGFWLGAVIGGAALVTPLSFIGNTTIMPPALYFDVFVHALVHGVLGVFVTPVFEAVLVWGLRESTIAQEELEVAPGAIPEPVPQTNSAIITPVSNPSRGRKP